MTTPAHSSLPWSVRKDSPSRHAILDANGSCFIDHIMGSDETRQANAKLICDSANAYPLAGELVKFIEDIRPFLGYDPEATLHKQADALLIRAREVMK